MDPKMQIGVPSIDGLSLSDDFVSLRILGECLITQALCLEIVLTFLLVDRYLL